MATACLIAFFFVGGWLVPIDPSFFQSSTSVLILLLTIDWLDPFLSGMILVLPPESIRKETLSTNRDAATGLKLAQSPSRHRYACSPSAAHSPRRVAISRFSFSGFAERTDNKTPLGRRSAVARQSQWCIVYRGECPVCAPRHRGFPPASLGDSMWASPQSGLPGSRLMYTGTSSERMSGVGRSATSANVCFSRAPRAATGPNAVVE
jgi:hypothetical protein